MGKSASILIALCLICTLSGPNTLGRDIYEIISQKSAAVPTLSSDDIEYCSVNHRIGKLVLCVKNNGAFGSTYFNSEMDCFTGERILACEYPKGSDTRYLYIGAFWIGAVVGRDTLVSMAATGWYGTGPSEFAPDVANVVRRSVGSADPLQAQAAVSEEDYIMTYSDRRTDGVAPDETGRPHIPLNVEVTQASYAWSYSYAEDFVLFDYKIWFRHRKFRFPHQRIQVRYLYRNPYAALYGLFSYEFEKLENCPGID